MNITFMTNSSGSWQIIGSNNTEHDGTYRQTTTDMNNYNTTYYWSVNITDGTVWSNKTYYFTTRLENLPPIVKDPSPANGALYVSLNPVLSVNVSEINGNLMNVTFRTNATGSWSDVGSNNSVGNGTYRQTTSNINNYNTKYWWGVNVSNDLYWVNKTYIFTTK